MSKSTNPNFMNGVPELLILRLLKDHEMYGYELVQAIRTVTNEAISLGEYGTLIAPVHVDDKWYYVWDLNGDGVHDLSANSNGKFDANGSVINPAGNGWQYDYMTHDVLDDIFKYSSDFTTLNTDKDTDDEHRFAQLNGVKLALPTIGDGAGFIDSDGYRAGTVADNVLAGESNPTYDDLLAIWDAHNGSGMGLDINGTSAGWQNSAYWSATTSANGHACLDFGDGKVYDFIDNTARYVAVQVL